MGFFELLLLAVGVSMDAFAVSICKGLASRNADLRSMCTVGAWFGGFQALMPAIGFFLGTLFAGAIEAIDHWVAFGLLALLGVNMLRDVFSSGCDCCGDAVEAGLGFKTMFVMAVATSVDALAVGISLAMAGGVNIFSAVTFIGMTTFCFSAAGMKIGSVFGSKFKKKAQLAGGLILIGIGLRILLEHLGIFA